LVGARIDETGSGDADVTCELEGDPSHAERESASPRRRAAEEAMMQAREARRDVSGVSEGEGRGIGRMFCQNGWRLTRGKWAIAREALGFWIGSNSFVH
jgi:hypothetical protein